MLYHCITKNYDKLLDNFLKSDIHIRDELVGRETTNRNDEEQGPTYKKTKKTGIQLATTEATKQRIMERVHNQKKCDTYGGNEIDGGTAQEAPRGLRRRDRRASWRHTSASSTS